MKVVHQLRELRQLLGALGPTSFVPTMGNLHEGHLDLVERAATFSQPTVVSIFVNPLQFAPHEDFNAYPRTRDADLAKLEAKNVDIAFVPLVSEIYPEAQSCFIQPADSLGSILEGAARPGFFTGVATVVLKLFNMVRPARAIFGAKDLQQVRVVEAMCRQLALDIEIVVNPTSRAADGLALSSRNGYLNPAERAEAPRLFRVLREMARAVGEGDTRFLQLEHRASAELIKHGWAVDYISVRRLIDLEPPSLIDRESLAILGAAKLGNTRLIDNVEVDRRR
ncbi:pantoate--beta-alanine ligase [Arboricoccus pini]|uniref:pantoate--beta-alanine ligase n=1 Tax=Arboricoccus pini TaxID=1963835 RepID=UPI000B50B140|nr:pantoate--beta-alanine ligase [Arboricoccus pini]